MPFISLIKYETVKNLHSKSTEMYCLIGLFINQEIVNFHPEFSLVTLRLQIF